MAMGASFDRGEDGQLHLAREGGHSHSRIVHAADVTGREIERALLTAVQKNPKIRLFEHHFAVDLLTSQVPIVSTVRKNGRHGEHSATSTQNSTVFPGKRIWGGCDLLVGRAHRDRRFRCVQEGEVVSCHGVDALDLRSGKVRTTIRLPLLHGSSGETC